MKKSRVIELGLLLAMAGALTGCRREPSVAQRCVDANGVVVDDKCCATQDQQRGSPGFVGGGYYPYRWYYGGYGTGLGSRVGNGSYDAPPAGTIVRPNSGGTVVRGGGSSTRGFFGSSGSGRSSGGSHAVS